MNLCLLLFGVSAWIGHGFDGSAGNLKGSNAFAGTLSAGFLKGVGPDTVGGGIPEPPFVMFQMTFAIITPALIVFVCKATVGLRVDGQAEEEGLDLAEHGETNCAK